MTDRTALMRQIALRKLADLREEAGKDGVALSQHRCRARGWRRGGAGRQMGSGAVMRFLRQFLTRRRLVAHMRVNRQRYAAERARRDGRGRFIKIRRGGGPHPDQSEARPISHTGTI
jgi:hypothetical protein